MWLQEVQECQYYGENYWPAGREEADGGEGGRQPREYWTPFFRDAKKIIVHKSNIIESCEMVAHSFSPKNKTKTTGQDIPTGQTKKGLANLS